MMRENGRDEELTMLEESRFEETKKSPKESGEGQKNVKHTPQKPASLAHYQAPATRENKNHSSFCPLIN
jgi:hypothetical protein